MSKRHAAALFRDRLQALIAQSGLSQTAFAAACGIDRSALTQLLSGRMLRLPRAETLVTIATRFQVSTDWLLGLTDDRHAALHPVPAVEAEAALDAQGRTAMERWHAEASGQKVRYVPALLPDLMRTEAVIAFQAQANEQERRRMQIQTRRRLHYSRMPESDIELCMPIQTLELFAEGRGVWRGLAAPDRQEQLAHIAATLEELYPRFRMYLFDGRSRYAPPMTLFGYSRAAVWAGEFYFHVRAKPLIHALAQAFDAHIRHSVVQAHEAAAYVKSLVVWPD